MSCLVIKPPAFPCSFRNAWWGRRLNSSKMIWIKRIKLAELRGVRSKRSSRSLQTKWKCTSNSRFDPLHHFDNIDVGCKMPYMKAQRALHLTVSSDLEPTIKLYTFKRVKALTDCFSKWCQELKLKHSLEENSEFARTKTQLLEAETEASPGNYWRPTKIQQTQQNDLFLKSHCCFPMFGLF